MQLASVSSSTKTPRVQAEKFSPLRSLTSELSYFQNLLKDQAGSVCLRKLIVVYFREMLDYDYDFWAADGYK